MVTFLGSVLPMCTTVARSGVKPAYQASRFLPTQSAWSGHWLRCAQASQVPVLLAAGRPPDSLFLPPAFSITVDIAQVSSSISGLVRPTVWDSRVVGKASEYTVWPPRLT